ncbi:MAG: insulinase family protein [Porphyromonas sp.]|nr:insulinase family protein [Porphyromonas sp.]
MSLEIGSLLTPFFVKLMIEELVLDNGLTVWLSEDHSEQSVYGTVVVRAGAKDSPNTGIAHYFEHIMFKGTERIGTVNYHAEAPLLQQIAEAYSRLSATQDEGERHEIQLEINKLNQAAAQYAIPNDFNNLIGKYGGTRLNAGTSYDYTLYHNTFSPNYLEQWCELNSERLLSPVFRLFQSELETVYEEKNMIEDRMGSKAMQKILERLAAPHPYQYPIIGSTQALKSPDLQAMEAFYRRYYVAGNMALILTGDFKRAGIETLLERTFGKLPAGQAKRPTWEPPRPLKRGDRLTVKLPLPFVRMSGYMWQTVPANHPDHLVLQVISQLLSNEGKTGRLDRLVLNRKLTSGAAFPLVLNDAGFFGIQLMPRLPLQTNRSALALALHEVESIKRGDFTDSELDRVLLSFRRSSILDREDPEKRHRLLEGLFAQGSNWQEAEAELARLEIITREEVIAVANRYLTEERLEIRKKRGDYPKEKLAKPPYEPIQTPNAGAKSDFAKYLATLPATPTKPQLLDFKNDVERMPLGKGTRAQLFKVDNPNNELFTLSLLYFRSDYHHPEQGQLAPYLDLVGGGGRSEHLHNEALQQLGATLTFTSTNSNFQITLTGYDHLLAETIELMGHFLRDPQVKPATIKQLVQAKHVDDKLVASDPNLLKQRLQQWAEYGEERAYYRKSYTLKQVRRLRAEELTASLLDLLTCELDAHYTGTRPIGEVASLLAHAINVEQVQKPWEGYLYIEPRVPTERHIYFVNDPKSTQSIVRVYRDLGVLDNEGRAAALFYNTYLGSGMGSLLFQEVREFRSLAYSVGAQLRSTTLNQPEERTGQVVSLSTQIDKTAEALRLVLELMEQTPSDPSRWSRTVNSIRSNAGSYFPKLRMRSRYISLYERQGLSEDYAKWLLDLSEQMTQEEMTGFFESQVGSLPSTIIMIADKRHLPIDQLREIAPVTELPRALLLP